MGIEGVRLMHRWANDGPVDVYVMAPSCVPATSLETSGADLSDDDLHVLMGEPWVLGMGELMNFPGVINRSPDVLGRIRMAHGVRVDGHAPALTGQRLSAYIIAGIGSDHECTDQAEAEEKLSRGMYIMIREGSSARNLEALLPLVTSGNARRFMFVSDDKNPVDLIAEGSIDFSVRKAMRLGLDPLTAITLASLNPAEYFPLPTRGAIAPGYHADLLIIDDLERLHIHRVYKDGLLVAKDGECLVAPPTHSGQIVSPSFHLPPVGRDHFAIPLQGRIIRVIEVVPDQIVTRTQLVEANIADGCAVADPERDILKVAVVERHKRTGNIGLGFVTGFGLRRGAIASSVAHDSHNVVVIGTEDGDMATALHTIISMGGGLVAVQDGTVQATLPLPVAGLLSLRPLIEVTEQFALLHRVVQEMGCRLRDPFMTLSFLALPVIPSLRLTDQGLVDVDTFAHVPLFEGA